MSGVFVCWLGWGFWLMIDGELSCPLGLIRMRLDVQGLFDLAALRLLTARYLGASAGTRLELQTELLLGLRACADALPPAAHTAHPARLWSKAAGAWPEPTAQECTIIPAVETLWEARC